MVRSLFSDAHSVVVRESLPGATPVCSKRKWPPGWAVIRATSAILNADNAGSM